MWPRVVVKQGDLTSFVASSFLKTLVDLMQLGQIKVPINYLARRKQLLVN